jgi:ANTAR domain/GAF domain
MKSIDHRHSPPGGWLRPAAARTNVRPTIVCEMSVDHPRADELARVLGNLAIELERQSDSESTLRAIVHSSVGLVPGVCWAGISLIEGRQVKSRVPTASLVAQLDEMQTQLSEGPCISALREHNTVQIDDMSTDDRWPRFAGVAQGLGVRSSLSFQLFVHAGTIGALNLYGDEIDAFDDDSFLVGTVLAQHASVAMAGAAAESHFQKALGTRDLIGQAKGLLMQRNDVTGLHAFQMLAKASQDTHLKLVEVAQWIVETHEAKLN